jgi:hypothetical protein
LYARHAYDFFLSVVDTLEADDLADSNWKAVGGLAEARTIIRSIIDAYRNAFKY